MACFDTLNFCISCYQPQDFDAFPSFQQDLYFLFTPCQDCQTSLLSAYLLQQDIYFYLL